MPDRQGAPGDRQPERVGEREPRPPRLVALDAFRGLTVAAMLLVNDPGSWGHMFRPLEHAAWNGWTPTDLIFPFFLFIVGITTQLSMDARRSRGATDADLLRQILRRSVLIAGIGLAMSWFPFFTWDSITGIADPTVLQRIADRPLHVRIPGILQRIGVVYGAVALIALRTPVRGQIAIACGILLAYWAALTLVPVPDTGLPGWAVFDHPASTLAAWTDRALLDWSASGWGNHIWAETKTWDPEGILSTVPAVGTAILGLIAGRWISARRPLPERIAGLLATGAAVALAGCMWGWVFPINKNLWTSSFVLLTGGLAAMTLGVCMWLIDERGIRRWAAPFVVFGVNPLVAFAGSEAAARLIYSVVTVPSGDGHAPLASVVYRSMYAPWLEPRMASLAFAVSFVLVWLGVLTVLYRRRIFLKV